ncbi:MAG: hypothetical protein RIR37_567 [Verrucomicrobiota bacterium]
METDHRQLVAPLNNTEFCTVDEVASLGFEPRITESKSGVLPLHYEAFGALDRPGGGRKVNRHPAIWQS